MFHSQYLYNACARVVYRRLSKKIDRSVFDKDQKKRLYPLEPLKTISLTILS